MGPTSRVVDYGAKALAAVAAVIAPAQAEGIDEAAASIPDPVGTFYRYSLPASLLHGRAHDRGSANEGASS